MEAIKGKGIKAALTMLANCDPYLYPKFRG